MICQECQKRPATLHYTKIINGEKTEMHLCEYCAKENNVMNFDQSSGFSINNLLAGLFNLNPNIEHINKEHPFSANQIIQCDNCGMTLDRFLKIGRFGCANCYEAFSEQLTPVFRRLHGGNWKHNGKIPKRAGGTINIRKKIEILKETLQTLVEREEFEKAAEVRDEIRFYEKQLQEGGE